MASKAIRGITIEIGGDTTKLGKALESVESKSRSLQSELKGVNTLLKLDPTNTTLLAQKQDLLKKAISETKDKLDTLKIAQKQVQEQFEKGEVTEEQYRDLQREIAATEIKLKDLNKELGEFGSVGIQKLAAVSEKLKNTGESITNVGKSIMPASLAAGAALTGVTKAAIDFESAWAGVTKTVDGTPEQLEEIRQGLMDMSQETASSAIDIAAVAEAAGQLGIKTENILEFTKTMVMLGDTTNLSADEAASALAKFANITQMSADNYGRLGAVIVDLGNNFATTEADIVAMATRLASTGEITGLSEAQIMALAAALSSAGIEAEAGGTAMAKLLKKLFTADAEFEKAQEVISATGSSLRELELLESLNTKAFGECAASLRLTKSELSHYMDTVGQMNSYAETAGVSVEEFRKAYAEDAVGALSMFIQGLNDTEQNGKSAVEILQEMGLTEVRLSNAVLAMASSGDLMTSAIETANTAWGENKALSEEAEKRYGTTESKITQLKNTISELCVKLGETLLPIVRQLVDKISELTEKFTNLSPAAQKVTLAITGLVTVLGPLIITLGTLITSIGTIVGFAPKLTTAFAAVKTAFSSTGAIGGALVKAFTAVKTAFTSLGAVLAANPIGIVIIAVTALIAAFVLLWNNCEGFRNFFINLWENIKVAFAAVVQWFSETIPKIGEFFVNLWNSIVNIYTNVAAWFSEHVITPLVNVFNIVIAWIKEHIIAPLAKFYETWILPVINKIVEILKKIVEIIVALFVGLWNLLREKVIDPIVAAFKALATKVAEFFKKLWADIVAIWNKVSSWFNSNVIQPVVNAFKSLWSAITSAAKSAWSAVSNAAKSAWSAIKSAFGSVKSWFSSTFTAAWTAVKGVFSKWGAFFSDLWSQIKNTFSRIGSNIAEAISTSVKAGLNGVISLIEGTINKGVGLINGAIDLINKLPGVSVSKISKLSLPRLARGGIVDSPTVAEIGEDGREAIVPLENNTEWLDVVARKLSERIPFGGGDDAVLSKLDGIYERLARLQIVLDSGTLVGETIDQIDAALADKQLLASRGG